MVPALEELSWLLMTTMRLDDAVAAAGSSLPPEWEPELSLRGASASPDSPVMAAASADPGFMAVVRVQAAALGSASATGESEGTYWELRGVSTSSVRAILCV